MVSGKKIKSKTNNKTQNFSSQSSYSQIYHGFISHFIKDLTCDPKHLILWISPAQKFIFQLEDRFISRFPLVMDKF